MPTPDIDFGELSADETKSIAKRALAELSVADVIDVINEAVDEDSMDEVIEQLKVK
jgi:hypothetical protein